MPTHYYEIYYEDGSYEQVYRYEDYIACQQSHKKIRKSVEHRLTNEGWKSKILIGGNN